MFFLFFFFFSSRRRHTRYWRDWSSDVCSSDLDDGRLALLETVREFAAERLDDARELRFRHAEHYVALAEEARSHARGPREKEWIERLTVELDNLRAVLAFSLEIRDAALGLRLAEALEPLWIRGMHQREALRWLEPLLGLEPQGDQAVRAGAFVLAGRSAIEAGEPQRARPWLETGLALARESGDERRTAWALHGLGHALAEAGDSGRACAGRRADDVPRLLRIPRRRSGAGAGAAREGDRAIPARRRRGRRRRLHSRPRRPRAGPRGPRGGRDALPRGAAAARALRLVVRPRVHGRRGRRGRRAGR